MRTGQAQHVVAVVGKTLVMRLQVAQGEAARSCFQVGIFPVQPDPQLTAVAEV